MQWVCSREEHSAGGTHYHMAVKLSHARRWLRVRNYLDDNYGIQVNFSANHSNYYSAWKYTTKEDSEYFESPSHPDLANSRPLTSQASQAKVEKNGSVTKSSRKRKNKLSIYQVSQIAVAKGIKSRLELLVLASGQKKEGKEDLAEFIANRGNKVVDEAIKVGWEMEEAEEKLKRNAPINSKLQHPPPPPGKPRAFELLKIGSFKFPPLGPKWCSNALPYCQICLSNAPPKEQWSSAPVIFNKACVQTCQHMFQLRRLFEWQGILQFKPKRRFFIRQCFFSFTIHCCFMAILKTSADTNAGQSRSLTHCIKKSTSYKELEN